MISMNSLLNRMRIMREEMKDMRATLEGEACPNSSEPRRNREETWRWVPPTETHYDIADWFYPDPPVDITPPDSVDQLPQLVDERPDLVTGGGRTPPPLEPLTSNIRERSRSPIVVVRKFEWTPDVLRRLHELKSEKLSNSRIAIILHTTTQSVKNRWSYENLQARVARGAEGENAEGVVE